MGFSLMVKYSDIPHNILDIWKCEFYKVGFIVEFDEGFCLSTWKGGLLPISFKAKSKELIHKFGEEEVPGGFEIDIYDGEIWTNSPLGRCVFEFYCQCIGTATLANALDGWYCDGQNGIECKGQEAITAALKEIEEYEKHVESERLYKENLPQIIKNYNEDIFTYNNENISCPRCKAKKDYIRFINRSPESKSLFICKSCGRSFGVEEIKKTNYRD